MKTIKVSKEEIKLFEILKKEAEISEIKEKISFFERKYRCNLKEFEKRIKRLKKENFEMWDDYIEWSGFVKYLHKLEKELKEIRNAENIKITE